MEKKLSDMKPGENGVITKVTGVEELRRRLLDMGLVKGTRIHLIRNAPLKDPIEVSVKGYNLSLRRKEGENVYVMVEDEHSEDAVSNATPK
ncbi:MAG: FeoA family protein [Candidatus Freyarchaeota archaeon]|nr:FeoA family protein [Candidatus Freyrarchaeum guaymaensis]HDO80935.1 ferrous iron transport protein A [Candidatus Bathyarchaeota archaeon]